MLKEIENFKNLKFIYEKQISNLQEQVNTARKGNGNEKKN